jgi:hypothetical protein
LLILSVLWLFWRPSQYVEVVWILTLINNIHIMNYGSVNQLVTSLWIMACYNLLTISILQWTIGPLECVNFFYFIFFNFFFNFSITHKRKCNKPKAAVIYSKQPNTHIQIETTTQSSGKVKFLNWVLPKLHGKVQFLTSYFSNTSIVVTTSIKEHKKNSKN